MNLSNMQNGRITHDERRKNLGFVRQLYTLWAIQLFIALVWTSFALGYYDEFGKGIVKWWEFAIVSGVLCLILILVCFILPMVREFPINIVVYIVFTLCFMHLVSYVCLVETAYYVYYALWLLFAISVGFAIYAWSTTTYMNTLMSMMVVMISCLLVFVVFLIFTDIRFVGLLLVLVVVLIYGFYLNYDVRKMVRGGLYEYSRNDPWTGAVRIWVEGLLVFFRFIELMGKGCCKDKQ